MTVITWNTHKTEAGYSYKVFTVGYQVSGVTLRTGSCATRAQAVGKAKAWTRYFKSIERQQVAA